MLELASSPLARSGRLPLAARVQAIIWTLGLSATRCECLSVRHRSQWRRRQLRWADKVADDNEVSAVVRDNTVTDTFGEGIHLEAGGSGEANDNDVDVTVRKNTVCGSTPT